MLVSSGDICNINQTDIFCLITGVNALPVDRKKKSHRWSGGTVHLGSIIFQNWFFEVVPRSLNDFLVVERGPVKVDRKFSACLT